MGKSYSAEVQEISKATNDLVAETRKDRMKLADNSHLVSLATIANQSHCRQLQHQEAKMKTLIEQRENLHKQDLETYKTTLEFTSTFKDGSVRLKAFKEALDKQPKIQATRWEDFEKGQQ